MRYLLPILLLLVVQAAWAEPTITLVRVSKENNNLQLLANEEVVREFHVVFGATPKGHKMQEGDEKTPEGSYTLDYKNPNSAFYKSIHISYPNAKDIASAKARGVKPGGQVMIHGQKNGLGWLAFISQHFNWTNGCVALSNADMDIVWALVKEGTPIEILP
ncbi:MAG: L,D-transpeptidase family protein [Pseudomonadota bacterium]